LVRYTPGKEIFFEIQKLENITKMKFKEKIKERIKKKKRRRKEK
jgi:hypothetical protein